MKHKIINKAIGYIRVSTKEQATEGYSIPEQKIQIISYCEKNNINIEHIIIDPGITSDVPFCDREGGKEIIKAIEYKEIDKIITIKLDRMFRDAGECITTIKKWNKKGINVNFIDSRTEYKNDSVGKIQFGIDALVAEYLKTKLRNEQEKLCDI